MYLFDADDQHVTEKLICICNIMTEKDGTWTTTLIYSQLIEYAKNTVKEAHKYIFTPH